MTADINNPPGPYTAPVTLAEKRVYGFDAERDPASGFIFEMGSGAHPRHVQAMIFQRRLRDVTWLEDFMRSETRAGPTANLIWPIVCAS
jgi:hypothetical protein